MKKLMLSLTLLALAASCDSPQRNRLPGSAATSNGVTQPTGTVPGPWTTVSGTGATGGSTGGTAVSTKPPGFESCDISDKYYAAGINRIGICQSTIDETSVAVYTTVTDSAKTCLIPTFKDANGSSTYLGQPQCFIPQQGNTSMGNLYKTRPGFTQNPINGVMVMKEGSILAYFNCMNAYANFKDYDCPNGARQSPMCAQRAGVEMTNLCNNFKAYHSYLDIRLKP